MERLLILIITTSAHLSLKNWREADSSFYSCSQTFFKVFVFQAIEEKAIRSVKEKFAVEQKRICKRWAVGTTIKAIFRHSTEIWVQLKSNHSRASRKEMEER